MLRLPAPPIVVRVNTSSCSQEVTTAAAAVAASAIPVFSTKERLRLLFR